MVNVNVVPFPGLEFLGNYFADGKSQSCTGNIVIGHHKTVEYLGKLFGRNTGAGVGHMKNNLVVHLFISKTDMSFLSKFSGIAYLVGEYLEEPVSIGRYVKRTNLLRFDNGSDKCF